MTTAAVAAYHEALALLEAHDEAPTFRCPADEPTVVELERELGVALPRSYREMLKTHGLLLFMGTTIYGLGKAEVTTRGGSGVHFQTTLRREKGVLRPGWVVIASAGYGPEMWMDCRGLDASGEGPVCLVPADGNLAEAELLGASFGAFLLAEVKMNLEHA